MFRIRVDKDTLLATPSGLIRASELTDGALVSGLSTYQSSFTAVSVTKSSEQEHTFIRANSGVCLTTSPRTLVLTADGPVKVLDLNSETRIRVAGDGPLFTYAEPTDLEYLKEASRMYGSLRSKDHEFADLAGKDPATLLMYLEHILFRPVPQVAIFLGPIAIGREIQVVLAAFGIYSTTRISEYSSPEIIVALNTTGTNPNMQLIGSPEKKGERLRPIFLATHSYNYASDADTVTILTETQVPIMCNGIYLIGTDQE